MGKRDKKHWDQRYEADKLPWDTGRPDTYLVQMVSRWPQSDSRVLEIGCGTGSNAVWLAAQGFQVTGMDISSSAIRIAGERAAEKKVHCQLEVANFLDCGLPEEQFSLVFDRGCFHASDGEQGREGFVRRVASSLEKGGLWFSLIGNRDEGVEAKGPPRLSAGQITASVEPFFEILRLESCLIESRSPVPPRFWQCLMRLR